jgi:hypothetical protein
LLFIEIILLLLELHLELIDDSLKLISKCHFGQILKVLNAVDLVIQNGRQYQRLIDDVFQKDMLQEMI